MDGLVTIHERADVVLMASQPLSGYRTSDSVSAWAFGDRQPGRDSEWQTAAVAVETPGLVVEPSQAILHAGAHGYVDVFHRTLDGASWFASRMDPLVDLDDARLEIDWENWACTLLLVVPIGDQTPFREVRRLTGATALVLDRATDRTRPLRWSPPWIGLPAPRPGGGDPRELYASFQRALSRYGSAPTALPLSGGYDSRLIGIALRDAGISTTAWTTSKDDGRDDASISVDVAAALGFPHTPINASTVPYADAATEVLCRFGYRAAQHIWACAIAAALRGQGHRVADGNTLDILLHSTHIPRAAVEATSRAERDDALFADLSRKRPAKHAMTVAATAWAIRCSAQLLGGRDRSSA